MRKLLILSFLLPLMAWAQSLHGADTLYGFEEALAKPAFGPHQEVLLNTSN